MADGYGLELGNLTETGRQFVDLAEDARRVKSEFTQGVQRQNGQNAGFSVTEVLTSLCDAWGSRLDELGQRTTTAGGLLNTSDQTYGEQETDVAGALDRIEPGGGSGSGLVSTGP